MVKLSDLLGRTDVKDLAVGTISIGDVYLMQMDESNGIHPAAGYATRRKFFVVLGFDDVFIYGGIVINSKVNMNIRGQILALHLPLSSKKYPFLSYDSFADCLRLKTADVREFEGWSYMGQIDDEDLEKIKSNITSSPLETKERLRMFHLIA